jgi:large subunit ribosomal protein L3
MGRDKVTVLNLKLVKVDLEKGVVLIRGALPGPRNCDLLVRKAIKKN